MSHKEIPGAMPWFGPSLEPLLEDIGKVLASGQLVQGAHVKNFEEQMASICGTQHAAAVSSGGTALELALAALDVTGKEVIVPTQTFIASANAVTRAGGIPVYADIDPETQCLAPEDVQNRITPNTAGIMFVHMFGLVPPAVLQIKALCEKKRLFLIEDAAHAHGASIAGQQAGSIGDVGCFSFFATKVITCGEGGMITTNNSKLHDTVVSLRNHGRCPGKPTFCLPGNNFRITEIQGILGSSQMTLLPQILEHRNNVADIYRRALASVPGITLLPVPEDARHAYWRFPAYLDAGADRTAFQKNMWDNHRIRITWMYDPLCHLQPVSGNTWVEGDFPAAEATGARLINLPTHMGVTLEDAAVVAKAVAKEAAGLA